RPGAGAPAAAGRGRRGPLKLSRGLYAVSIAGGLLVWELVAHGLPRAVLAPPSAVAARLVEGLAGGSLGLAFLGALRHLAVGYFLAIAVAAPLGFLMGRSRVVFDELDPV